MGTKCRNFNNITQLTLGDKHTAQSVNREQNKPWLEWGLGSRLVAPCLRDTQGPWRGWGFQKVIISFCSGIFAAPTIRGLLEAAAAQSLQLARHLPMANDEAGRDRFFFWAKILRFLVGLVFPFKKV